MKTITELKAELDILKNHIGVIVKEAVHNERQSLSQKIDDDVAGCECLKGDCMGCERLLKWKKENLA